MIDSLDPAASMRILVVEDHAAMRDGLQRYLTILGHRVATATSLSGGREELHREPFDLLIVDVDLPDGDGISLLSAPGAEACGAITMSAFDRAETYPLQIERHHRHLTKPFAGEELASAIRRAVPESGLCG